MLCNLYTKDLYYKHLNLGTLYVFLLNKGLKIFAWYGRKQSLLACTCTYRLEEISVWRLSNGGGSQII